MTYLQACYICAHLIQIDWVKSKDLNSFMLYVKEKELFLLKPSKTQKNWENILTHLCGVRGL